MTTDPYAQIKDVLDRIEKSKRILLTAPDVFESVRDAVSLLPFSGLLDVRLSQFVAPGQVVVLDPGAFATDRVGTF